MIAVQSENAFSPKPQAISRSASPVPSDIDSKFNHRRSSFSTDDHYQDKPLVTQRSLPYLKQPKHRRRSDATLTTDDMGSNGSFSVAASAESSTVALPLSTRFANDKRNNDFHTLFRSVPDEERLIEDYGCALQKEILLQGRVYISEHHLCFNANIFGWITNLVIAFADIIDIEKRSTAIFIPNAILISTESSKHFLASFLSRDHAYDQMLDIWKASRAYSSSIQIHNSGFKDDDATEFSGSDESDYTSSDYSYSEDDDEGDENDDGISGMQTKSINQINDKSNAALDERQASLASLPLPKHLSSADEAARRRAVSEAGPRPNMQEYIQKNTESTAKIKEASNTTKVPDSVAENIDEKKDTQIKEKTECECSKSDKHFPTTVMDNKYDTTIETMYTLLFNSPFMSKFLSEVEKSTEVSIGEWSNSEHCVHTRESSYIKYLGGSIGPKSTKCYLKEEVHHLDTADYVSQLTVTQTPDVPSGGSFTVKTRTCISWCGQGQVRVLVTVLVDFTKSSWLKSTIERASIDGQQNFYKSLDAAIRRYLDTHSADTKRVTNGGKRKGGKRRHKQRSHADKEAKPSVLEPVEEKQQHAVVQVLSSILNWLIENASAPSTSQLTALCMAVMVLTNIYIASKMAGVDKQLNQLGIKRGQQHQQESDYYQHHMHLNDEDHSLWRLLSRLDPDARKEDLHFVHHTRQPLAESFQHQNRNSNSGDEISDDQLEYSKMAKQKFDMQILELEKMIQKAGQSMEQVTHAVQGQRKRILNPE